MRSYLGLTQQQLAEELGTRQQTISEWERNMYQPRGTSSTLLTIVAERARFHYESGKPTPETNGKTPAAPRGSNQASTES